MTPRQLGYWVRETKPRLKGWSPYRDREYHDSIFAEADHDPFSYSYPGHITIRRFANLLSPHLDGASQALDPGCGRGEITCRLARLHPDVNFEEIDRAQQATETAVATSRG